MNTIHFTRKHPQYGAFSNFSHHAITIHNTEWPTVEHYYHAMKFLGSEHAELIRNAGSAAEARRMGRDLRRPIRPDWEEVKEDVMFAALEAKFEQHSELADLLVSTGCATLIEDNPRDSYWGCGSDSTGKNRLGMLLMRVRDQLNKQNLPEGGM